jgi:peptidoglycan/LPS O-acetylase OafA/YrhL
VTLPERVTTTPPLAGQEARPVVTATAQRTDRFYSLDVLRGLAALSVVFWHWQAFSYVDMQLSPTFSIRAQPLYVIFAPLYRASYLAVDLFFSLSGFIFYALYSDRVSRHRISAREFFILRLSRLFPLHLVTLLLVTIGQAIFFSLTQSYFVYRYNDAYHFVLNLLFASSWGLEKDHSFNGPFWSVSVEALLYAIFFCVCRLRPVSPRVTALMCIVGLALWPLYGPVGHGVFSFFVGGTVFLAYRRTLAHPPSGTLLALIVPLWLIPVVAAAVPVIASVPHFAPVASMYMRCLVFPATIYALAVYETERGTLGRRLAVIGDISYSIYLLHFPLQLLLAIVATAFGIGFAVFLSPYALVGFFAVLVAISYASHRWLEMPAQRSMRRRWLPARPPARAPA